MDSVQVVRVVQGEGMGPLPMVKVTGSSPLFGPKVQVGRVSRVWSRSKSAGFDKDISLSGFPADVRAPVGVW